MNRNFKKTFSIQNSWFIPTKTSKILNKWQRVGILVLFFILGGMFSNISLWIMSLCKTVCRLPHKLELSSDLLIILLDTYWSEKAMATHSSTLAWKIPWMEEPGRLQSMGSLRVGRDWVTSLSLFTFMHWRRKQQPTPVFLPGKSQGQRSLVGCRLWGHKMLYMHTIK